MLIFISNMGIDARSMWTLYEPDIPKCLRER
ncbi:MAG: cyclic lactone autoinducer peptide [Syntrophomonadaceae bacterium]